MNIKEAIEMLNYLLNPCHSEGAREAHKMAVEALKKQDQEEAAVYTNISDK